MRGSNWRFERVISLDIHLVDFIPLRGSTFIPLPKKIADKKAVINMKNDDDDQCFKWSVTRALNPVVKRIEKAIGKTELEWTQIPGGIEPDKNI